MRLGNLGGHPVVITPDGEGALDIASRSVFGPSHREVFDRWDEFRAWVGEVDLADAEPLDVSRLGPPSPTPTQVFAIGLNYAAHAVESGQPIPEHPTTFTKFASCLTGAHAVVDLPSDTVDYEVELVAVIGRRAERVARDAAWSYVAGLSVGQDLSERVVQLRPPVPQFSLGKSFPGFGPIGPWLVTPDEIAQRGDPDDLAISCRIDDSTMQDSRTSDLVFAVGEIIERVSHITPMLPGDIVFTGTPSGVGMGRDPQRYLRAGDVLESTIEGIGTIVTTFR